MLVHFDHGTTESSLENSVDLDKLASDEAI